jgi:hypothetical protein
MLEMWDGVEMVGIPCEAPEVRWGVGLVQWDNEVKFETVCWGPVRVVGQVELVVPVAV